MKKYIILLLSMVALAQPLSAQTQRLQLMERLQQLQRRGYMFGHQDDPFYGLTWEWERGRSDTKEASGDYPAVMGFDLGGIEMGDEKNLDSVPFTRIREELIAHHLRGGIVTLSWHPRNPYTGGTAWDNQDTTTVQSILPGGMQHRKFLSWMKNVRNFLRTLRDGHGRPIPVIFRPWHENNGGWFWWGAKQCTPKEYRALWCMLQDYLISEGFDNLVWSWSPNLGIKPSDFNTYPGDDRVQLVGIDGYQWGTKEDFVSQLDQNLAMLTKFAADRGKIAALTECGLKNLTDPTWWTSTLTPVLDKYGISYFLVWRNYKEEWFGPSPSKPDAPYFKEMYAKENVLFLNEIQ